MSEKKVKLELWTWECQRCARRFIDSVEWDKPVQVSCGSGDCIGSAAPRVLLRMVEGKTPQACRTFIQEFVQDRLANAVKAAES